MEDRNQGRWLVVAALFATMFFIWGPINASSVFFLPVVKHFGWSRAFFSLLVATAPLAAGFSSPAVGSLMDRYGERRIMMTGAAMVAMSFLALSQARSAPVFFVIFIMLGIGITAATIIPTALIITNWFHEQRGLALGIAFSGIPLGGTGITILASHIVQSAGFRAGYIAMAIPIAFIVIPLLALVVRTPPKQEKIAAERGASAVELPGLEVSQALRSRSFWMIAIVEVLFATAGVGLTGALGATADGYRLLGDTRRERPRRDVHLQCDRQFRNWTARRSFGRAHGAIADVRRQRDRYRCPVPRHASGFGRRFCLIFGLVRETPSAILPMALTESLGTKRLGTLLGLQALFRTIGFAAGPVIAGRIFDRTGSYSGALLMFIALDLSPRSRCARRCRSPRKFRAPPPARRRC